MKKRTFIILGAITILLLMINSTDTDKAIERCTKAGNSESYCMEGLK